MPSFSPLQLFVLPFIFLVALPLALCAGATTILAFLVLFLRLFLVYFDLGLETLRYIIIGHATQARYVTSRSTPAMTPSSTSPTPLPSPMTPTPFRHRRRAKRPGSAGNGSVSSASGFEGVFAGSTPSIGLERDFEGLGGWRWDSAANEQQWYKLNSRLENPYRRHHFRSQSGGAVLSGPAVPGSVPKLGSATTVSHSPERSRLAPSPNRSALRVPAINKPQGLTMTGQDEYFPNYDAKNSRKFVA